MTSHFRISGSRWVIIPSWLSRSLRPFWYSSSVYSCHLFLIPYASVRSILFLSFIVPVFAWNVPWLKQSLVFAILLFSSISLHCSRKKAFLSLLAVLWNTAFRWLCLSFPPLPFVSLLFSAICSIYGYVNFWTFLFPIDIFHVSCLPHISCSWSFNSLQFSLELTQDSMCILLL